MRNEKILVILVKPHLGLFLDGMNLFHARLAFNNFNLPAAGRPLTTLTITLHPPQKIRITLPHPLLPIFFSPLTFRPKPLEFNFFSNRSFQKLVTTCFVHKKCQKTFFFTTSNEYFCYSIAGLHARLFNHVQNAAEASCEVLLQPQKHGAPTRFGGRVWRIYQLHS